MTRSPKSRLVLAGVGVLLILLGVRGVALQVAGKSAHAGVTQVKRATGQQDDPMDHNYQISYRFSVDGKDYSGSLTRKKVYNTATLPSVGGTVAIRYLPAAPVINGGAGDGLLGGLVFGVLGIGLFVAGIKPQRSANQAVVTPGDTRADAQS